MTKISKTYTRAGGASLVLSNAMRCLVATVLSAVLGILSTALAAAQLVPTLGPPITVRLSLPSGAQGEAIEPSIAISPDNPGHLAVGAYSPQTIKGYYWASADAGHSWTNGNLQVPGEHGAVDPSIGFGLQCHVFFLHGDPGEPKKFLELWKKDLNHEGAYWVADGGLVMQLSEDCGREYTSKKLVENPSGQSAVDKDWLAIDSNSSSRYAGSLYAFWSILGDVWDQRPTATDINFSLSRDGGRTFTKPRQLAKNGYAVQAVVRSEGVLEVVWTNTRWNNKKIWHATSIDGGVTFSDPTLVTAVSGDSIVDLPSLAVSKTGSLILTWIQTSLRESQCGRTSSRTYYATFMRGSWSPPLPLQPNLPAGTSTRFPAAAATDDAFWVLAYRVDKHKTDLVLYRHPFDSDVFTEYAILATRHFGMKTFHPGPMWRDCSEGFKHIFFPGDYVGLAAGRHILAAAYVLPRDDDGKTPGIRSVYVSIVPLPQ